MSQLDDRTKLESEDAMNMIQYLSSNLVARDREELLAALQRHLIEDLGGGRAGEGVPAMDVRALLFCKSTFENLDYFTCFDPRKSGYEGDTTEENGVSKNSGTFYSYSALGSAADSIQVYNLNFESGKLLKAVYEDNNRISKKLGGSVFVTPQYIVYPNMENPDRKKYFDNFWSDKGASENFFFVTHFNLRSPLNDSKILEERRQALNDRIKEFRDEKWPNAFRYIVYNTLDLLNEYVVLWRAKNIRPVMETICSIYQEAAAFGMGHTRTVCSIPYERLKRDVSDDKFEEWLTSFKPEMGDIVGKVDHVTFRAVSHDYQHLTELRKSFLIIREKDSSYNLGDPDKLNNIGKHYTVLGNTDYTGIFSNVDDRTICRYLREVIKGIEEKELGMAITRLETSIGIEDKVGGKVEAGDNKTDTDDSQEAIRVASKWLLERLHALFTREELGNEKCKEWYHTILELCNMMVQMSRSSVYDSACFLWLDAVYHFYYWLAKCVVPKKEKEGELEKCLLEQQPHINQFIFGLTQLSDVVTRGVGTVTHIAGYSPLVYHISTCVIEPCQAFFTEAARYLRWIDEGKHTNLENGMSAHKEDYKPEEDVSCILVPAQCERISTDGYFRGCEAGSSMIYIEVPIDVLCDPSLIAIMLAHETGHHFCLQAVGRRDVRCKKYAEALVDWASRRIGFNNEEYNAFSDLFFKDFDIKYEGKLAKAKADKDTEVFRFHNTMELCSDSMRDVLSKFSEKNTDFRDDIHDFLQSQEEDVFISFSKMLRVLRLLFDETFCDVLMLNLLSKDKYVYIKEYLHMCFHKSEMDKLYAKTEKSHNIVLEDIYARIFLVGETLGFWSTADWKEYLDGLCDDGEFTHVKDKIETLTERIRTYHKYLASLETAEEDAEDMYPPGTMKAVLEYLRGCQKKMQKRMEPEEEALKKIRDAFEIIVHGQFFDAPYYDLLYQNRCRVLKNINIDDTCLTLNGASKRKYKFN